MAKRLIRPLLEINSLSMSQKTCSVSCLQWGAAAPRTYPLSSSLVQRSFASSVQAVSPEETKCLIRNPDLTKQGGKQVQGKIPGASAPLVLLFGWGGASYKNLGKYEDIYREIGCCTLQYILPTRHIFRDTNQVPDVMLQIWKKVEEAGLSDRQIFVHCLSDTGVMCYQGLSIALRKQGAPLLPRGVVWDSCPGPYPEITLTRVTALLLIYWFCSLRDGRGLVGSLSSCYSLLVERGWPNYIRRLNGLPVDLNLIDGEWCGYFGRDHRAGIPELFLYSKRDFYLPWRYLEKEVLAKRSDAGREFESVCWTSSSHVSHYKKYKKEYRRHVQDFVLRQLKLADALPMMKKYQGVAEPVSNY